MSEALGEALDHALALVPTWEVPSAAAVVFDVGGVLGTVGDVDAPFALASLTKPLAALAALVAVEEEALELDQPLPLPAYPPHAHDVTLRHLLAHASGLDPEGRRWSFAPATRRIYSNAGIEAVGAATEAATGIAFADYLRDAVAGPLGLTSVRVPGSPARDGIASARDYATLLHQFLAPSGWLHPTTLAAAATVQWPGLRGVLPGYGGQADNTWGLGLEVRGVKSPHWTGTRNSPATFGHFGQSGTMAWVDPVAGVGAVALAARAFGPWAATAWPVFSDAVLHAVRP